MPNAQKNPRSQGSPSKRGSQKGGKGLGRPRSPVKESSTPRGKHSASKTQRSAKKRSRKDPPSVRAKAGARAKDGESPVRQMMDGVDGAGELEENGVPGELEEQEESWADLPPLPAMLPGTSSSRASSTRLSRPIRKVQDQLLRRAATTIGADELASVLLAQPENSKYGELVKRLADSALDRSDITSLARECGVSWSDIVQLFREHQFQLTAVVAARQMPVVASDIAENAKNKLKLCPQCYGERSIELEKFTGSNDEEGNPIVERRIVACIECDGTGYIIQTGDSGSQSMLMEMGDLIKKKAPNMNVFGSIGQLNLGGQQAQFVTVGQKLVEQRMAEPPAGMQSQAEKASTRVVDVKAEKEGGA